MDQEVVNFFECLFGKTLSNGLGEIELRVISKTAYGKSKVSPSFHNSIQDACIMASQSLDRNVFFGVNPRIGGHGKKENVKYLVCFHADIDYGIIGHKKPPKWSTEENAFKAIQEFPLKPTYVVKSGGGFHCYWVLQESLSVEKYGLEVLENIDKQLCNALGDSGTHDIGRILRVPNTYNYKFEEPRKVEIVLDSKTLYQYEEIIEALAKITVKPEKEDKPVISVSIEQQKQNQEYSLNTLCPSPKFKKLITEGNNDSYESRSEADMAVVDYLVNNGRSDEEIKFIYDKYAIGEKYREHTDPKHYLQSTINSARNTSNIKEDDCNSELFKKGILPQTKNKIIFQPVPFQEHLSDKYKILTDGSSFYQYNEKCYESCSAQEINRISQNELNVYRNLFTPTELKSVIHFMEGGSGKDPNVMEKENMSYLTLQNGLYDISNDLLISHTPDIFTRNLLPYGYDPKAECPGFIKYLGEVFENDIDKIAFVQEAVGYCFHKAIPVARIFFLVGGGSNGKSVFIDVLTSLFGEKNTSHVGLSSFSNDAYIMQLNGKMLNVSTETVNHKLIDSDKIKAATSGDIIQGKALYKDPVSFRPYAKHFIAMNHVPNLQDNSYAMRRRVEIIEFSNTFTSTADTYLKEKLKDELSGIFIWAIQGYKRLLENKFKFTKSRIMEDQKNEIMDEMNTVIQFIKDKIKPLKDGRVEFSLVYEKYRDYCKNIKQQEERKSNFKRLMVEQGYVINNSTRDQNKVFIFDVDIDNI